MSDKNFHFLIQWIILIVILFFWDDMDGDHLIGLGNDVRFAVDRVDVLARFVATLSFPPAGYELA